MGDPKFSRRKFNRPSHPWKANRIRSESELVAKFGLKNKQEVWKANYKLSSYRKQARQLLAMTNITEHFERQQANLVKHLFRFGLVPRPEADLPTVLGLTVENILARRLQSQVYFRGLATTQKQARQLIVHGHIGVDGRKMTVPGYLVPIEQEDLIAYHGNSPLTNELHPVRPSMRGSTHMVAAPVVVEEYYEAEATPSEAEPAAEPAADEPAAEAEAEPAPEGDA